jgi:Kef-type K+ transport system membrane component KefB
MKVAGTVTASHDMELLAEIGVVRLLSAQGLEFNLQKLGRIGTIAFVARLITCCNSHYCYLFSPS